ncbi:14281_t:CDS:2 [Funneliformis geosporum]|uniref:mitogen-activated protein kinase kinase n=1 Tax=Funneliformis geosporum TaxID=1117311 RepID=A0A9W4SXE2_9GLOM|nr:14281_t:CDS:2 [Funneliformis geosporum]
MKADVVCKIFKQDDVNAIQHEIKIQIRGHVCDNIIRFLGITRGCAKITDFGHSKSSETQTIIHDKAFGMLPYMAPEFLNTNNQRPPYSVKTDIYSLGFLFWKISSGHPPFSNNSDDYLLHFQIIKGMREEKVPDTPDDYCELYNSCWDKIPENRPKIEHVYLWLKDIINSHRIINNAQPTIKNQKDNEIESTVCNLLEKNKTT